MMGAGDCSGWATVFFRPITDEDRRTKDIHGVVENGEFWRVYRWASGGQYKHW